MYERRSMRAVASLMKSQENEKAPTKKSSVSFETSVATVQIMGLDAYTRQEIEASWYTDEDMENLARRCMHILHRVENGRGANAGKKYCMRGLEGHTRGGSISKRRNRDAAITSVLAEQRRQLEGYGEIDFQSLAQAYSRTTSSSSMWATVVGQRDQQAAEEYLSSIEDSCESIGQHNLLQTRDRTLSRQVPKTTRGPRSSSNHSMNAKAA